MSELSDLLRGAPNAPSSTREASRRIDGRLHWATIAKYLRGDHPAHPDEATLQGLAEAYGLPLAKVQAAAGVPVGAGPYRPPAEAARLNRRQQAAITELIMAMTEAMGGQDDAGQAEAQKTITRGELDVAAFKTATPLRDTEFNGPDDGA